jgi:flagellar basal body rod protein FlgG
VTANNIANVNTTGFKGSRAEFADLYPVSTYGVETERRFLAHELPAVKPQVPSPQRMPRLLEKNSSGSSVGRLWSWIRNRRQQRAA